MKTLTKTVFALLLTATVFTSSAFISPVSATTIVVPATAENFNRISVAGNVKIILSQSANEGITVSDEFSTEDLSVKRSGQTLYINSTGAGQITVNIAVKDLQRITAAGGAVVEMRNNFELKYLQLFLSQRARVKVNAKIESLYTVISDDATLKINGSAAGHTLMASNMKNVKFGDFSGSRINSVPVQDVKLALAK